MTDEKMWLIENIEATILADPINLVCNLVDQIQELNQSVEALVELAIMWGAEELPELNDKQFTGLI